MFRRGIQRNSTSWCASRRRGMLRGGAITAHSQVLMPEWLDALSPAIWYRETVTIGTGISAWVDLSGNSADAVQATAGKQPAVGAALNGHTGVAFDGVDDFLQTASGVDATTWSGISVLLVMKAVSTTLKAFVDKALNATAAGCYINLNNVAAGNSDLYLQGSTSAQKGRRASGAVPTATNLILAAVFDPSRADADECKLYANNVLQSTSTVVAGETTGNLGNAKLTLAALTDGTAPWAGTMWEFIMIPKAVSAASVSVFTSYASSRYGIAI